MPRQGALWQDTAVMHIQTFKCTIWRLQHPIQAALCIYNGRAACMKVHSCIHYRPSLEKLSGTVKTRE